MIALLNVLGWRQRGGALSISPGSKKEGADRPCACRFCGDPGRAAIEHETRGGERYAQVACHRCEARGPAVRFELSDEWPHIAAEQSAVAKWDTMMRGKSWT